MRIRLPLRLTLVATSASGLILAVLFTATIIGVRSTTFAERRNELTTAVDAFLLDPNEPFDLEEFHEAHPTFTAGVFGGPTPRITGSLPIRPVNGLVRTQDALMYGRRFQGRQIVAVLDWSEPEKGIQSLALVLAILWAPLTLLIAAVTYLSARAMFRPLERLTAQAATSAGSELGDRLSTEDEAEFGEFAHALNGMLDRIESEVRRGDRFATDAAHELRTPLAILRTRIDTALLNVRTPEEYMEVLHRARAEIVRLTDVAQALLRTTRGEAAAAPPLPLAPIVSGIVDVWQDRFADRTIRLWVQSEERSASITAEELRIALDNLLDNALRFAPPGSEVLVRLGRSDSEVEISVEDSGDGFSEELGGRAFDRLVRGDDSRNRATGGAGIGLSVVRRIAESRGGRAFYRPTPGGGATIAFRLPAVESILSPEGQGKRAIVSG